MENYTNQPPPGIYRFSHGYRFLSNFFPSEVYFDGLSYPTVEHAFQAAKTLDIAQRSHIRAQPTPAKAKEEGRKVKLRPDWETVKVQVMYLLLVQKFSRPDLRESLLATGDLRLVEGNTWGDTYWGVCNGEGTNVLGKLLMTVRNVMFIHVNETKLTN